MTFTKKLCISFAVTSLLFSCNKEEKTEIKEDSSTSELSIDYEKIILDNGLEVILHKDSSDPIVAVATMMHVGSNREKPGKTGFAHFFEHMSFNDSENVPVGANRKMIPEWGGERNGGTWSDGTVYYEVVPKDAFDKILWIDSDRLGFMINTVTEAALEREKQVVKNEKRERVDNNPYGYTDEVIRKNLYPQDHPYHWTVIGSLPDLQSATLEDVKEFYNEYYGANNATLVIAGDIDIEETKEKVKRWFGEIRRGPEVKPLQPMPVQLDETKSLYFEDNFAKLPELRMVYPTVEQYHPDSYALSMLGQLLSGSKKSPLYQIVVEEKKLAPNISTYQRDNELTGEFYFRVRANAGKDLDDVKSAISDGLKRFEENGFEDSELERIKAQMETDLYQGFSTVLNKAFQLATYNEYKGDPGYIMETAKLMNAVSREDINRVYEKYIKDKNYVLTSFVPKGQQDLAVADSKRAEVWIEEVTNNVANEEVSQGEEAVYAKTPTKYDRNEPEFGELPMLKAPEVYTTSLSNGIEIYGIENDELPLVQFDITIPGGHLLDPKDKAGLSYLMTDLMMEGTVNKTPAELEEAIDLLGARISISSGTEEIRLTGACLAKNFTKTVALAEEILLQPRWDEKEFNRLKQSLITRLQGREANPQEIASINYNKLIYGTDHILGIPGSGTLETVNSITLDDVKQHYTSLSPKNAVIHIAGDVSQNAAKDTFDSLAYNWKSSDVEIPSVTVDTIQKGNQLYFINIPGSKQSVIYAGKIALSGKNEDYNNLDYANEILGGGSSGRLFQTLRIEKGYTYGAYSYIRQQEHKAPFTVTTSVRANATLPSLQIISDMLKQYEDSFGVNEVETTKTKLLKGSTRSYEDLGDKLRILREMSKYDKSSDFIEKEQQELLAMTLEDFKSIINTYISEDQMIYVVVGDKATQFDQIKKLGKEVIELDIHGNRI
ncbi:MAG: peptidase M16 [Aquimarina sp.]|nr:peptidase M16 [Aquimarina sp.]